MKITKTQLREMIKDVLNESGILYKAGVKKYGKEGMAKILSAAGKKKSHAEIGKIKDKYEKESVELDEGGMGILTSDQSDVLQAIVMRNKSKNTKAILNVALKSGFFKGVDKKELLGYIDGARQFVKYMKSHPMESVTEKHKVKINERNEHEEVFGVEIVRVIQNTEDVAYRVDNSSGRRTMGTFKEYSIDKLGDDKAFEQAKKEALKIVRGWK